MKKVFPFLFLLFISLPGFSNKERWDENKQDWSELMLAIYNGKDQKVTKLIASGVDLNFETSGKHSRWKLTAIEVAIRKSNVFAARELLNTGTIKEPKSYLYTACAQDSAAIIEMLIEHGANVNDTLENGYSMLMMAASFGSYEVMECLLKHGANMSQRRSVDGITALMLAADAGDYYKVQLLANDQNKKAKDLNGHTALYYIEHIDDRYKIDPVTKEKIMELLK